jgi:hypothetical protein
MKINLKALIINNLETVNFNGKLLPFSFQFNTLHNIVVFFFCLTDEEYYDSITSLAIAHFSGRTCS